MKFYIKIPITIAVIMASFSSKGESKEDSAKANTFTKATNFTLPSSVAFNLLDANPSQVFRPGFAKDLKLDWVIKDNKIASNIAVEAQPIWLFFMRGTDYNKLSKYNNVQKALSSLTLSLGTASKNNINSLAWGAKINLYAKKNPIYDTNYINTISDFTGRPGTRLAELNSKIGELQFEIDTVGGKTVNSDKKTKVTREIDSIRKLITKDSTVHFGEIAKTIAEYEKDNWNSTLIDLGYGRVYNYLSQSFDSLSFQSNGSGLWLSGNVGFGKHILINGMLKYTTLSGKNITTTGANFRYGNINTNFFVEGLYNFSADDNLKKITIAYGGEIKIRNMAALQFGLRTDYTKDFKLKNLIPLINFNYLLGNQ